jgi:hypothetical protein
MTPATDCQAREAAVAGLRGRGWALEWLEEWVPDRRQPNSIGLFSRNPRVGARRPLSLGAAGPAVLLKNVGTI